MQDMERRIARAGGHRSDDEARVLNGRIQKLTETLQGVNVEHTMLLEQVKQAEVDLGDAKRINNHLQVRPTAAACWGEEKGFTC